MAHGATVYNFELVLSDVDRGVYETLTFRVAQHPSESDAYMVARILAYGLEYEEGLEFGPGLSTADTPALAVNDLTGQLLAWIDIGTPAADRLHRVSKAADRVAVYCHKPPAPWLATLAGQRVHQSERIAIYAFDPRFIQDLAEILARRNAWALSRVEGELYIESDGQSHIGAVTQLPWPERAP